MNFKIAMVCGAMMLAASAPIPCAWAAAENMVAQASSDSGYRVGDTLPPVKPRTPSGGLRGHRLGFCFRRAGASRR